MKINVRTFTLSEAADILAALGCGDDPVTYRGRETTVHNIYMDELADPLATRRRIRYWARGVRQVRGTVQDMVVDRLRRTRG